MTVERLYLTRDCWWMNPSGTNYVSDELGNLSTYSHGIYKSINGDLGVDDATYLWFHGNNSNPPVGDPPMLDSSRWTDKYTARLKSTNIVPTQVKIGVRASATNDASVIILINGIQIGSVAGGGGLGFTTTESASGIFNLTTTQQERIFHGRIEDNYDYVQTYMWSSLGDVDGKIYDMEVYYSGDASWNNYETGLPNLATSYHYPVRLDFRGGSIWANAAGSTVNHSGYYNINKSPSAVGVDTTYIKHAVTPSNAASTWLSTNLMPSGGLSLYFTVTSGDITALQDVTRAVLNLRMSLPPSGLYENARDTFEVNGYNKYGKESDWFDDIPELSLSRASRARKYGYFVYGAGDIIEQSGFKNYAVELNFLNPNTWAENSGNVASVYHRNSDILQNMEFQLVGLPSGVQLSSAELMLERRQNTSMTLYTAGDVYKTVVGAYPDTSGYQNISLGNGMWHHRGNLSEAEFFDGFYKFNEASGAYTYPTTNNPDISGSLGTYLYLDFVEGVIPSIGDYIVADTPKKHNYYRSPIVATALSDSPTAYRDMVKLSVDKTNTIFFDERINIGRDFTLYFKLYQDAFEDDLKNRVCFFRRGYFPWSIYQEPSEIICYKKPNKIEAEIHNQYGQRYTLACEYELTTEPVLVVLNCQYSATTTNTTVNLYVHPGLETFFARDWISDSVTFNGSRLIKANPKTMIGDLFFANFASRGSGIFAEEFGFSNSYVALETDLNNATIQNNYNTSTSSDKRFFSSRASISPYLYNPGSGINWYVPDGSGSAEWNTRFFIDDWIDDSTYYELVAPITTAYTNYNSNPSGIYVELLASHITNNPSGAVVTIDIEMDSASTDNWKVWQTEIVVPSGSTNTKYTGTLKRHIGLECPPIKYSDISSITLNLDTQYPNVGQNYFGDLTIDSVKVYFDSSCTAATGTGTLALYTYGGYQTSTNNLDLFVKNFGSSSGVLDLYTLSIASASSGVDIYTSGGPPTSTATMNLYINGLTPGYASGNFPLFTYATEAGVGGFYKSMPLFTDSIDKAYTLPLYISGPSHADLTASMNLFVYHDSNLTTNNVNLFVLGPSGIYEDITLYIRGDGTTAGAYPSNGLMNLFIARDSEGFDARLPLYLCQNTTTHTFDMFTEGCVVATSSIPLYIYGSGVITNNVKLYTHGY